MGGDQREGWNLCLGYLSSSVQPWLLIKYFSKRSVYSMDMLMFRPKYFSNKVFLDNIIRSSEKNREGSHFTEGAHEGH